MAFKFLVVITLVTLTIVAAAPFGHESYSHGGGGGGSGGSGGAGGDGGASSHQSVHIVQHGGGDDHGDYGHYEHDFGGSDDEKDEYNFNYGVNDQKTGDIKTHQETRKGHSVSGHYELVDADGHKRTVYYTADKHKGFQATVQRTPTQQKVPAPKHGSGYTGGKVEFTASSSGGGQKGGGQDFGGHDFGGHDFGGHDTSGHGDYSGYSQGASEPKSHSYSLTQDHGTGGGYEQSYDFGGQESTGHGYESQDYGGYGGHGKH